MKTLFAVKDNWESSSKNTLRFPKNSKSDKDSSLSGVKQSKKKAKNKQKGKNSTITLKKSSLKLIPDVVKEAEQEKEKDQDQDQDQGAPRTSEGGPTKLAQKLRKSLKGGHFRFINEKLYSTDGANAKKMFERSPAEFAAYHEGYRHQIQQWPLNPLDRIIKYVKKAPISYVIADFGCGEGRLAKSVNQKVYSIDLVSANSDIIACDMANTPLESNSIDMAIYCLSLMGTNIQDFILEANRVLKIGGTVYVAEIASRFENANVFIKMMRSWGFDLKQKDLTHKLFYYFIFKKAKCVAKDEVNENFSLKPCLYKKR